MRKSLLSAVALTSLLAFSGSAWADLLVGVAGPITGPNAAFGAQLQKGAEGGVRAGDRSGDADQHVSPGTAAECEQRRQRDSGQE